MAATGPNAPDSSNAMPVTLLAPVFWMTIGIELATVLLRFGFALESTRDTASTIGWMTGGVRIHHGYCGLVVVLVAWGLSQHSRDLAKWCYIIGWALFLSDVIHHFLVLWPITGSPQFDLLYPPLSS